MWQGKIDQDKLWQFARSYPGMPMDQVETLYREHLYEINLLKDQYKCAACGDKLSKKRILGSDNPMLTNGFVRCLSCGKMYPFQEKG